MKPLTPTEIARKCEQARGLQRYLDEYESMPLKLILKAMLADEIDCLQREIRTGKAVDR